MVKLDAINERILRELTADGRTSNLELAERVGLSPSACLRRVQELERSGVIKGYRAVLDRAAMGVGFVAYITVGLSDHSKASQEAFERSISRA
ncbi:MAG: Lrp/AsnC family transcriptional regulator, partial [Pseudomonadota bacterium]